MSLSVINLEPQKPPGPILNKSKICTSPVWAVISRIRFRGEIIPYVFHHEQGCYTVMNWSGNLSSIKDSC